MEERNTELVEKKLVTKKIIIDEHTFKELRKIGIDIDMDKDNPTSLGEIVTFLVKGKK